MRLPLTNLLVVTLAMGAGPGGAPVLYSQGQPESDYWVYVAAESEDQVALLRFGPAGLHVQKTIEVGIRPIETEGPHGLRVSPDGEHWYVSLAHGYPFGSVHKYRTGTDLWEGSAEVGMFPATIDVAASTGLLYVANFDLHGGMTPGSVSVVDTESMAEVARVEAGVMPHGSRLSASGDRHYAVMMMSDELVEMNAWAFEVSRRLPLTDHARHGGAGGMAMAVSRPTWVELAPDGGRAWLALNGSNEIMEIDIGNWEVSRTFATAPGPYNIGLSPDGRWLVVSYRNDGSTGVWDLGRGTEVARIRNSRPLTHGVAVSPDSRYAFVSVEGVGAQAGAVDVIDLEALELAATAEVGKQASGIAFWKMEAAPDRSR